MTQWIRRLPPKKETVGSSPIKGSWFRDLSLKHDYVNSARSTRSNLTNRAPPRARRENHTAKQLKRTTLTPSHGVLGGRRLIHWATKADKSYAVLNCSCELPALSDFVSGKLVPLHAEYPDFQIYIPSTRISRYPVFPGTTRE